MSDVGISLRSWVLLGLAAAIVACDSRPDPADKSASKPRIKRPWEVVKELPFDCGGSGPQAGFTPATRKHPNLLILRLKGGTVTAAQAETMLRGCLTTLASERHLTSEAQATVWWSPSGRDDDYRTVPVPDGSSQLIYQPEGRRILTWKERWLPTAPVTR